MSDNTAQIDNSLQPNDSTPANMPLEAPQAPANEVVSTPVKDDNLAQNVPEGQSVATSQTPQTDEISPIPEQKSEPTPPTQLIPDTPKAPETGTAQTPPNEPLGSFTEPNIPEPEPTPTPAEPVFPKPNLARQLIAKAREAIQNRKRKKIDRILDLFAKRTNITNNQVGEFLHVSDATTTRYLQVLENENKIRQVGKTGKGVKYEKI